MIGVMLYVKADVFLDIVHVWFSMEKFLVNIFQYKVYWYLIIGTLNCLQLWVSSLLDMLLGRDFCEVFHWAEIAVNSINIFFSD